MGVELDQQPPVGFEAQPGPAAAEARHRLLGQHCLEGVVGAEPLVDGVREGAFRCPAAASFHHLPEQRVVVVPPGVVAHGRAESHRHAALITEQVLDRLLLQVRQLGNGLVEVLDVLGVVLVVVDLHCPGVDVGLQGVVGIGQRRHGERAGGRGRPSGGRSQGGGGVWAETVRFIA